jgi:hypothetical protein
MHVCMHICIYTYIYMYIYIYMIQKTQILNVCIRRHVCVDLMACAYLEHFVVLEIAVTYMIAQFPLMLLHLHISVCMHVCT